MCSVPPSDAEKPDSETERPTGELGAGQRSAAKEGRHNSGAECDLGARPVRLSPAFSQPPISQTTTRLQGATGANLGANVLKPRLTQCDPLRASAQVRMRDPGSASPRPGHIRGDCFGTKRPP